MCKVTVIIPSFNHEKFIAAAIQSVLEQTFQDFEIIITDDASSDNTVLEIEKFNDPRIKFFKFKENQGAYFAVDNCLKYAKGDYIAILSSDDMFLPKKLEKQVKFLSDNQDYAAVFGFAQIIDEQGNDFNKDHFYSKIFIQENRSRHEWLKKFFYEGNCLCHPSVLIRKEFYTSEKFDFRYRQLPDFDFWIKLCSSEEIFILQENLIKFRILNNELNTSGNTIENKNRAQFEYSKILELYLNLNLEDLKKIFLFENKYKFELESYMIPYLISEEALSIKENSHQLFSINTLYKLFSNKESIYKLKTFFNFSLNDYFDVVSKSNVDSLISYERNEKIIELINIVNKKDSQIIDLNSVVDEYRNKDIFRKIKIFLNKLRLKNEK